MGILDRFRRRESSTERSTHIDLPPASPVIPTDLGIFAGLFVASADEVAAWTMEDLTPPAWPAMTFKRISGVELGTLESILTGVRYDEISDELHTLVKSGGEEGPWVVSVRPQLVTALAGLPAEGVSPAARSWSETDEFNIVVPADGRLVAWLTEALAEAAELARVAVEQSKPMWLLMSL